MIFVQLVVKKKNIVHNTSQMSDTSEIWNFGRFNKNEMYMAIFHEFLWIWFFLDILYQDSNTEKAIHAPALEFNDILWISY